MKTAVKRVDHPVGPMSALEQRFNLRGKIAIVVGGAGHLGSTVASAMAESGMHVTVLDMAEEQAPRTGPSPIIRLHGDATVKADLVQCRETLLAKHGRVDVLLNATGINAPTPFFDIAEEEFERIMRTNLLATLYGCQVFGESMVKQHGGSIINFASVSIGPPLSKAFVYSCAKAGVFSLTQNLAREWARMGVRVNALRPGFFPTPWSMEHFIDASRQEAILNHTPMRRFGKPEELVGAVLWLASDASSFVTGSLVTVDGGFTAMTI